MICSYNRRWGTRRCTGGHTWHRISLLRPDIIKQHRPTNLCPFPVSPSPPPASPSPTLSSFPPPHLLLPMPLPHCHLSLLILNTEYPYWDRVSLNKINQPTFAPSPPTASPSPPLSPPHLHFPCPLPVAIFPPPPPHLFLFVHLPATTLHSQHHQRELIVTAHFTCCVQPGEGGGAILSILNHTK